MFELSKRRCCPPKLVRLAFFFILAIVLLGWSAVTVSAGDSGPQVPVGHPHGGAIAQSRAFLRGIRDLGYLKEGSWDSPYEIDGVSAIPFAPQPIVNQAPRRSEIGERPTVEMTPSGVQIVRGPGSRHID